MKQALAAITLCILALGVSPGTVLAGPDEYIGDAGIYTLAGGSVGVKPNILFIIDNSFASQNVSVGFAYDPGTTYSGTYNPWDIHVGDNLGGFSNVRLANETNALTALTCDTDIDDNPDTTETIKDSLLLYGSYAGAGAASHPNIGSNGGCQTAPKGEVYLLGNYLNYLNTSPGDPDGTGSCLSAQDADGGVIIVAGPTNPTKNNRYQLKTDHTAAADNKPGDDVDAPDWTTYWDYIGGKNDFNANNIWANGTEFRIDTACPLESAVGVFGSSQREIIYNALESVLNGAKGAAYFGAMVYGNNNHGGEIIIDPDNAANTTDIADISDSANLTNFLDLLPGSPSTKAAAVLSSNTARPQAEALYDAGYYLNAEYSGITMTRRIPSAFDTVDCGTTHVILITNGLSNGDGGSASTLGLIGDWDNDNWPDEAVHGEGSHYLDDVASYLNGEMSVTTHTVLAFQSHETLVENTAVDGGGEFYNVYNPAELQKALEDLILNIMLETNSAFVAPVVPSNPENRTYSGSRIYLGLFRTVAGSDWIGNIKKYAIDSSGAILDKDGVNSTTASGDFKSETISFWGSETDGGKVDKGGLGAKLMERVPLTATAAFTDLTFRDIYSNLDTSVTGTYGGTDLTHANNRFNRSIAPATIGVSTDAERDDLVNYIYGHDSYDNDGNSITVEPRTQYSPEDESTAGWLMGDTLHAKPAIVNYNVYRIADNATDLAAGTRYQEDTCPSDWATASGSFNKTVIYAGTNDGMLHAFSDCDGEELWSFIPDNLLPQLNNLHDPVHTYFMDASPTIYSYDKNKDGNIDSADGDRVVMIVGQRRGGSLDTNTDASASFGAYYALDITIPDQPEFLWKLDRTVSGFSEMGQTWSQPKLAKVKHGGVDKIVAIIGAGYDNLNEDGRFGNTQLFSDSDVGASTSDGDTVTSTGTVAAGALTNNPKGRGIFAFLVATPTSTGVTIAAAPTLIWSFTHNIGSNPGALGSNWAEDMDYSIPSDVAVIDTDFDGYIDRLYVGDTGGQLWRISAHQSSSPNAPYASSNISTWFGKRIFDANYDATDATITKGRKLFFRPSVVILPDHIGVVFGSGDRAHPMNNAVANRIFAIKDKNQLHNDHIGLDDLVDTNLYGAPTNDEEPSDGSCDAGDTENQCLREQLKVSSSYGWFIDANDTEEKFLASALVFNGTIYQTSYLPVVATPGTCAPTEIGTSRLYALDYFTSGAAMNFHAGNDNTDGTVVLTSDDRFQDFGTGIPPEVTVTIPKDGDPRVILPKPDGITVEETSSNKVVFPLYWWQK
jgi:type IV pilus assembly protein PilY1